MGPTGNARGSTRPTTPTSSVRPVCGVPEPAPRLRELPMNGERTRDEHPGLAAFAVTRNGTRLAERIRRQLGSDVYSPLRLTHPKEGSAEKPTTENLLYPEGGLRPAIAEAF